MPQIVDVKGVGRVSFPDEMSMDDINKALDKEFGGQEKPESSALGAAARSFGTSVGPTAIGMAAAEPFMGPAAALAPETFGASLLVPLAVGGVAGGLAAWGQGKAIHALAPGLEAQQAADVEQHPLASMGGRLAGVLPSAELAPGQSLRALASIPQAIRGATPAAQALARKAVTGVGLNVGLQEALTAGQTLIGEHRLPTPEEAGESAVAGLLFGRSRFRAKDIPRKPTTPEQRQQHESVFTEALGKMGQNVREVVPGAIPGRPDDVMHTLPDGSVVVSKAQFHQQLDQYLAQGRTVDEGIATMIEEEAIHNAVPDEEALTVWNSMTKAEQWMIKRIYHGPGMAGKKALTPEGYGHEAIRFFLQRERGAPTEYVFGARDEIEASRLLSTIEKAVRRSRELLGTKASAVQKDALNRLLDNVKVSKEEIRRGVQHALSQQEATSRPAGSPHAGAGTELLRDPEPFEKSLATAHADLTASGSPFSPADLLSHAATLHGVDDPTGAGMKQLGDLLQAYALTQKPGGSINVKGERDVVAKVSSILHNRQVAQSVIRLVPVDVVNNLIGSKLTTEELFNNPSVLQNALSKGVDITIARRFLNSLIHEHKFTLQGESYASKIGKAKTVHGDVRPPTGEGEGQVPTEEGGPGILPQAKRRVAPEVQVSLADRVKAQHKIIEGLHPGEAILESAVMTGGGAMGKGQPVYGSNHPDILDKIDPSGGLRKQFETRESRNTRDFGYRTNLRPFVSRMDLKVRKTGKVPHSDDIASFFEPDKKVGDQKDVGTSKAPPTAPTEGAPPPAQAKGKAVAVGGTAPTAGPATTSISTTVEPVKSQELQSIVQRINDLQRQPFSIPNVKEMRALAQREYQIRREMGEMQGRQGEARPMAAKGGFADDESIRRHQDALIKMGLFTPEGVPTPLGHELAPAIDAKPEDAPPMPEWAKERLRRRVKWAKDEGFLGPKPDEPKPMAAKQPLHPMDEKQVLVKIASILHGSSLDPISRKQVFDQVSDVVLSVPPEQRGQVLTQFEAQFAEEQKSAKAAELVRAGKVPGIRPGARDVTTAASDENIRAIFGGLDQQGLDARLIFELNHEPEVVPGGTSRKVKTQMGGRKGEEVVESTFREPKYNYRGRWEQVWKAIHSRDPSLPESLVRDRYINRVHQFLAYAPAETLRRLIIIAGAADRFLGREIVTEEGGQKVVRYTRTIPEPNLEPAVMDMAKAPSPDKTTEFEKFCLAKGITVEKGKQLLEEYKLEWGRQQLELKNREEAIKSKYAPRKGATPAEAEAMRKEGRAALADLKQAQKELKEGGNLNQLRRDKAVNYLADWLIDESAPPEAMPNRGDVSLDQIWFDHPDGHQGYREFTPEQGGDSLFLREYLGRGAQVPGRTASKFTRGVTVVVGPDKTVSALSTYRHPTNGQVMIYDPASAPGEKNRGYVRLNKVLAAGYRVKSYMLVYDPLTDFHQKWTAEGERSAENVFDSQIGTQADLQSRGKMAGLTSLINEGVRPEGAEEDDIGDVTPESMYALNAWLHSKGGQTWGFFGTDPQALIRGPVTAVEADALYRAFKENKVQSVDDWWRVIERMKSDRKIAESKPMAELFRLQPWEYCFTSAIEKIARKRYRELVTGTGHYAPDPNTGFPDPEATRFREAIKNYPPLPEGFMKKYVQLKGEEADKLWKTLTEDQKTRYRLIEYYRQNELLNALQYAYETAKEVQAQHLSAGGAADVAGEVSAAPDTRAFRQRTIAEYGDTARREVEQDAVRKTVSRQYAGRPVPRVRGEIPEPGTRLTARGLTQQVPEYLEKGTTKVPGPQRYLIREQAASAAPPRWPTTLYRQLAERSWGRPEQGRRGATGVEPILPEQPSPFAGMTELTRKSKVPFPKDPGPPEKWFPKAMARKDDPLAMTSKGHGVANIYQQEMQEQGRAYFDPKDPDQAPQMTKAQIIGEGRDLVLSGKIRPELEMAYAKETAKQYGAPYNMNWQNEVAWRYYDYKLQQMADALAEQHSPQAKEARDISDAWHKDFNEIAKASAARAMHGLQGYTVIGPGDMQSITFVRRMYASARAAAEGYEPGEEYDLTPQEVQWVVEKVNQIKAATGDVQGEAATLDKKAQEGVEVVHDEGNQIAIEKATQKIVDIRQKAQSGLKERGMGTAGLDVSAMAKKEGEGEAPKISDKDQSELTDLGMAVMMELSANGKMTDANWKQSMIEELNSDRVRRPDLEEHLDHTRALAEQKRMDLINNVIGTGDPFKSAREHFTRKQPTVEESIAAIRRALSIDPQATNITPMEAYHVWNYLRNRFFSGDKPDWDIRNIRQKAGQELGVGATRLFRAMSSNRSMREPTDALLKKMRDEQRIRSQATNWLKNLEYPWWFRTLRAFPRLFFFDKILGHGLVPLVTHSANMMFNPYAWKVYFKAWPEMYKMAITGGTIDGKKLSAGEYHRTRMQELTGSDRFEWWKRRGLEHDPFKYSDDYLIEWVYNLFEEKGLGGRALAKLNIPGREFLQAMIGGRSFDVLKQLRYARAEQWLNSLPEHMRTKEMGDLIADSVNHATGIVSKNFGEAGNWLLFAPKLEASRWAWLFRDTIKAADYWRRSDATVEQKMWARSELKQKGAILAMYWGMLGLNQAFLKYVLGSDQEINALDPTKSDFMQFKAAGFRVGVMSPIIGIYKLFGTLMHDMIGERTKFEKLTTRQRAVGEHLFEYARGKASPIASAGLEMATAQSTYPARPLGFLPWSEGLTRRQRLSGMTPYEPGEYAAETFAPIPLEEVLRETWGEMGVDETTQGKWLRALIIGGSMAATGARVATDVQR